MKRSTLIRRLRSVRLRMQAELALSGLDTTLTPEETALLMDICDGCELNFDETAAVIGESLGQMLMPVVPVTPLREVAR